MGYFQVIFRLVKICIPVRQSTCKKALEQVKKAQKYADFIEIWLDNLKMSDFKALIKASSLPVIAKCSKIQRVEILKKAVQCGAKFVDSGIHTNRLRQGGATFKNLIRDLEKTCKKYKAKLIISQHFWDKTPNLNFLLKTAIKAKNLGADIVKIATYVKRWPDNVILFELTKRLKASGVKNIVVGMGEKGKISRIGCVLLGGFLTYIALDEKSRTAEGQMEVAE